MRIPSDEMRGRTGNVLYKELCERVDLYPWASRHTWNSWRNRYKTKRAQIDRMIKEWLEEHPQPAAGKGKGQYVVSLSKNLQRHPVAPGISSTDGHGSSDEEHPRTAKSRRGSKRRRSKSTSDSEEPPAKRNGKRRLDSSEEDGDEAGGCAEVMMLANLS